MLIVLECRVQNRIPGTNEVSRSTLSLTDRHVKSGLPDEIGNGGAHAALDVELRHRHARKGKPFHQAHIKAVKLCACPTVH